MGQRGFNEAYDVLVEIRIWGKYLAETASATGRDSSRRTSGCKEDLTGSASLSAPVSGAPRQSWPLQSPLHRGIHDAKLPIPSRRRPRNFPDKPEAAIASCSSVAPSVLVLTRLRTTARLPPAVSRRSFDLLLPLAGANSAPVTPTLPLYPG